MESEADSLLIGRLLDALRNADAAQACIKYNEEGVSASRSLQELLQEAIELENRIKGLLRDTPHPHNQTFHVIGLLLERGKDYIVSALAIILSGNVFLPLNPTWPSTRTHIALSEAQAPLIITSKRFSHHQGCSGGILHSSDDWKPKDCQILSLPSPGITNDDSLIQPACVSAEEVEAVLKRCVLSGMQQKIAYRMLTSGSSGKPKPVHGTFAGLLNRVSWMEQAYPWQPNDVVCFSAPVVFVDSIWQMFAPLLAGVLLVIADIDTIRHPQRFVEFLVNNRVTHLTAVPTLLRVLLPHLKDQHQALSLRQVVGSGEALTAQLLKDLQEALPECKILNLYGCTEAAGDSLYFDATNYKVTNSETACSKNASRAEYVPVGQPIAGTLVFIGKVGKDRMSEANEPPIVIAEPKEVGEICICGKGLAEASSNRQPERTVSISQLLCNTQSFLKAKDFHLDPKGTLRALRTGDLGRIGDHGVELLGRLDQQVKIAGVRVNLLETEAVLLTHHLVDAAAAKMVQGPHDAHMVAFVTLSSSGSRMDEDCLLLDLQRHCRARLIPEACPSQIVLLSQLPQLDSGKVDRNLLKLPEDNPEPEHASSAVGVGNTRTTISMSELNPTSELRIISVFRERLGQPGLEPIEDFWHAGGTSLMATQICSSLNIPVDAIYAYPSARGLARHLIGLRNKRNDEENHFLQQRKAGELQANVGKQPGILACPMNHPAKKRKLSSPGTIVPKLCGFVVTHTNVAVSKPAMNPIEMDDRNKSLEDCQPVDSPVKAVPGGSTLKELHLNKAALPNPENSVGEDNGDPGDLHGEQEGADGLKVEENGRTGSTWHCHWAVKLEKCVDSSPVIVVQPDPGKTAGLGGKPVGEHQSWWAIACSHGGEVVCVHGPSGEAVWRCQLQEPTNSSLLVTMDLRAVVVPSESTLHVLDIKTGQESWQIRCEGAIRATPTADRASGIIWATNHSRRTLVLDLARTLQLRLHTGHASSTSVVFLPGKHLAVVTNLRGGALGFCTLRIQAAFADFLTKQERGQSPSASAERCLKDLTDWVGMQGVKPEWEWAIGDPIVANPAVDPSTNNIILASVTGTVVALNHKGAAQWEVKLDGPIYAPVFSLPQSMCLIASKSLTLTTIHARTGRKLHSFSAGQAGQTLNAIGLKQSLSQDWRIQDLGSSLRGISDLKGTCGCTVSSFLVSTSDNLLKKISISVDNVEKQESNKETTQRFETCVEEMFEVPDSVFSAAVWCSDFCVFGCRNDFLYCCSKSLLDQERDFSS